MDIPLRFLILLGVIYIIAFVIGWISMLVIKFVVARFLPNQFKKWPYVLISFVYFLLCWLLLFFLMVTDKSEFGPLILMFFMMLFIPIALAELIRILVMQKQKFALWGATSATIASPLAQTGLILVLLFIAMSSYWLIIFPHY